jgi:Abnormal spindle-like microcephaly-assoc'd, ASPM-SPD-2-Hydin
MLSANLTTLSFGTVGLGKTTTQSVTVTNTGTSNVTIDQTAVTGTSFSTGAGAPAASIAPGQGKTIKIQFAPLSTGSAAGGFTLTSDATNSPLSVALVGMGAQPGLAISPATVNFGNVLVGHSGTQAITLTNTSSSNVVVNLATVSGSAFGISGLTLPATIAAGQSVSFNAQFMPASTGAGTGSISFTDNAAGSPQSIILSGSGVTQSSALGASPASAAFSSVSIGNTGKLTITLSNSGNAIVTISGVTTTGTGFSAIGLTTPLAIPAGQGTTFTAQFAPATAGSASGSIAITSNASNATLSIALSGSGAAAGQPQISASPASMGFGNVSVGSSSPKSVSLQNTGNAPLTITQASTSGAGFSMSGLSMPMTINAGSSTTFTATFAPTTSGSASGSISIASNVTGSPLTIALSGAGTQAQLGAVPGTAAFGNVSTGNSNSQTISLTNNGTASLVISRASVAGTGFSITGLSAPLTIPTGSNVTFNAVFTPNAAGSVTGSISLTSNAPNSPLTIALSGTGVAGTQMLSFSTSSLSFGSVNVGSSSNLSASLTNTGNSSVTVSAVNVTGAGFTVSGVNSGETLTAGQSVPVTVQFAPTAAGAISGNISLVSNATNSPVSLGLSGSGAQQSTHTVGLSWTDSATTVAGYNVYRGTNTGGPYVSKLTTSPLTSTQFTDTGLQSGLTYYYVVTAVDSNGVESVYSNQATALIP